jgi:hypothetical protein
MLKASENMVDFVSLLVSGQEVINFLLLLLVEHIEAIKIIIE